MHWVLEVTPLDVVPETLLDVIRASSIWPLYESSYMTRYE